jgi:hypothetical protein
LNIFENFSAGYFIHRVLRSLVDPCYDLRPGKNPCLCNCFPFVSPYDIASVNVHGLQQSKRFIAFSVGSNYRTKHNGGPKRFQVADSVRSTAQQYLFILNVNNRNGRLGAKPRANAFQINVYKKIADNKNTFAGKTINDPLITRVLHTI